MVGIYLHGGELLCWALGSSEASATRGPETGSETRPTWAPTAQWPSDRPQDSMGWWIVTHFSSGEKSVGF